MVKRQRQTTRFNNRRLSTKRQIRLKSNRVSLF
jgi:hypothetical protein